jgi:predicted lipopolysaccharide heptosyltransferase III
MLLQFFSNLSMSAAEQKDRVRQAMHSATRMLVIRLRSLGDSILILPLIGALHEWRPDLQIDVLAENPFAPVFHDHPAVHQTLVLQGRNSGEGLSRARAIMEIRRHRYPVVLNLHGGTTSAMVSLTSRASFRVGQEGYRSRWAYNAVMPRSSELWGKTSLHTVEHQLSFMRWLGLPVPEQPRGALPLKSDAVIRMRQRLQARGISDYILMHPTATLQTKQWQPSNFAALADSLVSRCSIPIVFTAGQSESAVLQEVSAHASVAHQYWSDLSLEELFALIHDCRLFVGNDSGPTHAAAALARPVVVVWGSSNPRAWHPWGTDYELIRSDLSCIPCPGYTCAVYGQPKCILEIPSSTVLEACTRILSRCP